MMDETDQRLIAELRRDGRAALSDLAERLGLSRATVRGADGAVDGAGRDCRVHRADPRRCEPRPRCAALMMIGIEGRGAERITARLSGLPAVQAVHSTNGKWDLIAEIGTTTLPELDEVIARSATSRASPPRKPTCC